MYIINKKDKYIIKNDDFEFILSEKRLKKFQNQEFLSGIEMVEKVFKLNSDDYNRWIFNKTFQPVILALYKNNNIEFVSGSNRIKLGDLKKYDEINDKYKLLCDYVSPDLHYAQQQIEDYKNFNKVITKDKIYYRKTKKAVDSNYINLSTLPKLNDKIIWSEVKNNKVEFRYYNESSNISIQDKLKISSIKYNRVSLQYKQKTIEIDLIALYRVQLGALFFKQKENILFVEYKPKFQTIKEVEDYFSTNKEKKYLNDDLIQYYKNGYTIEILDMSKLILKNTPKRYLIDWEKNIGNSFSYSNCWGKNDIYINSIIKNGKKVIGLELIYDNKTKVIKKSSYSNMFKSIRNSFEIYELSETKQESIYNNEFLNNIIYHESDKYRSMNSNKKIKFKCPYCESANSQSIKETYQKGIKCIKCNDQSSYPEKVVKALLNINNISYEKEKVFKNIGRYRFDFYVPSENCVIEVHGSQHYREHNHFFKSLEDNQQNDLNKKIGIESLGIKYIDINASQSIAELILEDCKDKLKFLNNFELKDVLKDLQFLENNHYQIYNEYINNKENLSQLASKYNLSVSAISSIIRKFGGNVIQKNEYLDNKKRQVICLNNMKIYPSIHDTAICFPDKKPNNSRKKVLEVCKGRSKSYCGTRWMYYEEYLENKKDIHKMLKDEKHSPKMARIRRNRRRS